MINGDAGDTSPRRYLNVTTLSVLLPPLHLFGCVMAGDRVITSFFCIGGTLYPASALVWYLLAAALPLGVAAVFVRRLRPLYWILLALTPLALAVQSAVVGAGLLNCGYI